MNNLLDDKKQDYHMVRLSDEAYRILNKDKDTSTGSEYILKCLKYYRDNKSVLVEIRELLGALKINSQTSLGLQCEVLNKLGVINTDATLSKN